MVHAHATTYAWAWTTDDSTDAFNVVNAIATTYAVDATSALEAERAMHDAKDAMSTSFTDALQCHNSQHSMMLSLLSASIPPFAEMMHSTLTNNADEFGGQTIPEKVAEILHEQPTVIVKLTPTSVAPERQRLNSYTNEIFQAILIRLPSATYNAILQNEARHQLISIAFGRGAFYCQVKQSIATYILPPFVTREKKMHVEANDGTVITLVSEMSEETVREKKESYLKATVKIPLVTIDPGPEVIKTSLNAALGHLNMPKVDKVRVMWLRARL